MRVGEVASLQISPSYGYGDSGAFDAIPPNSTLKFMIELLSSNPKRKDKWLMSVEEKIQEANNEKELANKLLTADNDIAEAIRAYKKALDYLSESQGWPDAETSLSKPIQLSLHLNLALCYLKSKQYGDAVICASDAIKIDPSNSKAYYRRGLARMNSGMHDEAKADLIEANKLENSKNAEILRALQQCEMIIKKQLIKDKSKYQDIFKKLDLYEDKELLPMQHDISKLPKVFLLIKIGKSEPKQLDIVLYSDTVPKTAENFRALCTGEKCADDKSYLTFKNSIFHRIIANFMMQGGDTTKSDGTGGESIYGSRFNDENFLDKHDARGILSMANCGKDTNSSQFFITFAPTPHLDGNHVVFGKVIGAMDLLDEVEKIATDENNKPKVDVRIVDCGELKIE